MKQLNQEGIKFIQAAKNFEKSEIESIRKQSKIAWRIALVSVIVAAASVVAVAGLTPLKSVQPFVIRVDNNTGLTDTVSVLKTKQNTYDEVIDKYWLGQYIQYRESYDWNTIQATYDTTNLLSAPTVQNEFNQIYSAPTAPHKALKDNFKIIAKVRAISFVGNMAQVRFTKQTIPLTGDKSRNIPEQKLIATIAYEYISTSQSEQDRLINPLGFQVTSYRVDPESPTQ